MSANLLRSTVVAVVGASVLLAAPFWEAAEPESWTQAQIDELLSDSPWAKPAEVTYTGDRGGRFPGGVGVPGGGGGGRTPLPRTGPWPGAGGGIGFPYRSEAFEADSTIVWTSAAPVREALARQGVREELRDTYLADYYVVTLDGLPLPLAPLAETPEAFRNGARIERKNRPAIRATRVEIRPGPGVPNVELYFPSDGSLSADEKYVEVVLAAGDYAIRKKFKPAEMVYRGRLEM